MTWFRCPECGDEMPDKYRRTHPALCLLASHLAQQHVERFLAEIQG